MKLVWLTDDSEKSLPVSIVIDEGADVAVLRIVGATVLRYEARVVRPTLRRFIRQSRHVISEYILGKHLEHRHLD